MSYKSDAPASTTCSRPDQPDDDGARAVKPTLDAGRLVPLAISSTSRSRLLPNVPAYGETGIAELKDYSYRAGRLCRRRGDPEERQKGSRTRSCSRARPRRAPIAGGDTYSKSSLRPRRSSPGNCARELDRTAGSSQAARSRSNEMRTMNDMPGDNRSLPMRARSLRRNVG